MTRTIVSNCFGRILRGITTVTFFQCATKTLNRPECRSKKDEREKEEEKRELLRQPADCLQDDDQTDSRACGDAQCCMQFISVERACLHVISPRLKKGNHA